MYFGLPTPAHHRPEPEAQTSEVKPGDTVYMQGMATPFTVTRMTATGYVVKWVADGMEKCQEFAATLFAPATTATAAEAAPEVEPEPAIEPAIETPAEPEVEPAPTESEEK